MAVVPLIPRIGKNLNEGGVEHAHQVQNGEEMSLLLHGDNTEDLLPFLGVLRRCEIKEKRIHDVLLNMKKENLQTTLERHYGHRRHNVE